MYIYCFLGVLCHHVLLVLKFFLFKLPSDAVTSLGGQVVDRTVSAFIAATIKHLGLANAAQDFIQNKVNLTQKLAYSFFFFQSVFYFFFLFSDSLCIP